MAVNSGFQKTDETEWEKVSVAAETVGKKCKDYG
jgi:hypothetical protein